MLSAAASAQAAGDLLVAPTRVVLDGPRGTELILKNNGTTTATYRISLELKRMNADGTLSDIAPGAATAKETATLAMISYAPRRVTLPPNQPQAIRIGVRAPAGLADGEYRAHMLFRAIPEAVAPSAAATTGQGLSIALTPIYGVTIPIIVRRGNLSAAAAISDVKLVRDANVAQLAFSLTRTGDRSVYGRIRVMKPGSTQPLYEARGIAVYPELPMRTVRLPLPAAIAAKLSGPVLVEYREDNDGGALIARTDAVLR